MSHVMRQHEVARPSSSPYKQTSQYFRLCAGGASWPQHAAAAGMRSARHVEGGPVQLLRAITVVQ